MENDFVQIPKGNVKEIVLQTNDEKSTVGTKYTSRKLMLTIFFTLLFTYLLIFHNEKFNQDSYILMMGIIVGSYFAANTVTSFSKNKKTITTK